MLQGELDSRLESVDLYVRLCAIFLRGVKDRAEIGVG